MNEWRFDRRELDVQLSPSRSAKQAHATMAGWQRGSALALAGNDHAVHADLCYGPAERQRLDLFLPRATPPRGCPLFAFLHGGFWQEGAKDWSSFAAPAFTAAGWAYAAIGYTLAPQASLSEIDDEVHAAIAYLQAKAVDVGIDAARIVVAGHSAGAHLAASLVAGARAEHGAAKPPLAGLVLISGVYDLALVRPSYVNDLVQITDREEIQLSPLRFRPIADLPVCILVGADEPAAFLNQSEALATAWGPHLNALTLERLAGRDHFDVLDVLADLPARL